MKKLQIVACLFLIGALAVLKAQQPPAAPQGRAGGGGRGQQNPTPQVPASGVMYFDAKTVVDAVNRPNAFVAAPDLSVQVNKRVQAGGVEVHDKESDVFYVLDGEATFVTGGTLEGGRSTRPGQQMGSAISGGDTYHLAKGDVIVVEAGVPHWFKEVPQSITYYVVKSIRP